jgi:hypothetical protein
MRYTELSLEWFKLFGRWKIEARGIFPEFKTACVSKNRVAGLCEVAKTCAEFKKSAT